jgi:predicted acetylornithine/succinylornithine family transaminase
MATMTLPAPTVPSDALLNTYKRAPMEIVRGAGCELFDADGRAYLDFTAGIAVMALGHGDAGVANAVREALESGLIHVSNLFRSAPGERLAARLVDLSFADRVFFCNSGAEANEGAFKFARKWARQLGGPAKHEILALRGAFHGRLFATLAATDRPQYRAPFRPLAGGISIVERDLDELRVVLDAERVAALIVEPVQGEGGMRVLDSGFLREVRALTRERGIALILDEIQCGLGRTGTLFAHQQAGITPDVMTIAKPLAGGLPMGAILLTAEIADAILPGDHGSTFGGGPLVSHVALHVLERVASATMLAHVRETGAWFGEALHALQARSARVRAVRGVGLMWGVDVTPAAADVAAQARDRGLLLVSAGEHTIRFLPPLIVTQKELARGLAVFEEALGAA